MIQINLKMPKTYPKTLIMHPISETKKRETALKAKDDNHAPCQKIKITSSTMSGMQTSTM